MRAIDRMVRTAVMSPRAPSVPLPGPAFNGPEDMIAAVRNGSAEVFAPRPATPRPIPAARVVATLDVLIVLSLFVALIIGINLDHMPDGLDGFLALRFTVKNVIVVGGFVAAIALVCHTVGLYNALRVRRWGDEVKRVLMATIAISVLAALAPLAGRSNATVDRLSLLLFAIVTFAALTTFHALRASFTHDAQRHRAPIIGTGRRALRIYQALSVDVLTPYSVLGFVDAPRASANVNISFSERRTLGRLEELETLLGREHVDEVYIGLPVKSQ